MRVRMRVKMRVRNASLLPLLSPDPLVPSLAASPSISSLPIYPPFLRLPYSPVVLGPSQFARTLGGGGEAVPASDIRPLPVLRASMNHLLRIALAPPPAAPHSPSSPPFSAAPAPLPSSPALQVAGSPPSSPGSQTPWQGCCQCSWSPARPTGQVRGRHRGE